MGAGKSKAANYSSSDALDPATQEALKEAVAAAVRENPADPLTFIASQLCAKSGKPALPPPTSDYLSTIGNTPMIKLSKMLPAESKARAVYVKLEMQNPGGSIKDRIAKNMLDEAEKSGKLKPGMTVVEGTSGNTGIGLAMACAAKGYKCIIMMPQVPPMFERYIIARQFGAEVLLTAPAKGFDGLLGAFRDLVDSDPAKSVEAEKAVARGVVRSAASSNSRVRARVRGRCRAGTLASTSFTTSTTPPRTTRRPGRRSGPRRAATSTTSSTASARAAPSRAPVSPAVLVISLPSETRRCTLTSRHCVLLWARHLAPRLRSCVMGAGKYLKEKKPSLKILAIEPSNSRVHVGETPTG